PIDQVREIRPLETITKMPNTDEYVKGIMNLRGKVIPVIDVKQKIGFSSGVITSSKSRILVAEVNGKLTGLLIDQVDQVMRITSKDIEYTLSGGLESVSCIQGIAKTSGALIILLDVTKLLEGFGSK
ncbi:MAG: purine-binding chemotaxis protein CheW, partial [Thaumarchaeota archaeon]|nr:purine-binding chemotaxis protein CheW [Nitrososphaerota archaeon]